MALVAYDCSDESETENDETPIIVEEIRKSNVKKPIDISKIQLSDEEDEPIPSTSKSFLPAPSKLAPSSAVEDEDEVPVVKLNLPPPKKGKLKSTDVAFSLQPLIQKTVLMKSSSDESNDTAQEEDEKPKYNPLTGSKLALLSMLPKPQYERDPLPDKSKSKPLLPQSFLKAKPMPSKTNTPAKTSTPAETPSAIENDDDDDVDTGGDFFSLNKNDFEDLPEPIDIDISLPAPTVPYKGPNPRETGEGSSGEYTVPKKPENFEITYEGSSGNSLNIDEQTLQRHFGRKRKGDAMNDVEVIDVSRDDVLAESKRLVTMQLTEEGAGMVPYRLSGPSTLSKRKHQITYLAFQAKARETELKNFWAQNRLTKKQTQQKYGF